MGKIRVENKQFFLEKDELYMSVHYALCYDKFKKDLAAVKDGAHAINYSADKIQTSGGQDPTFELAARRVKLEEKIKNIEEAAKEAAGEFLYPYIMKAITQEAAGYTLLKTRYNIPCGKNLFYTLKRKTYYILAHKI